MAKIKVLVAESNFEEKNTLKNIFEENKSFEVVSCVEDGEEALQVATEYKTDVVICNFALKKIDGITLCEKLKEKNPKTKIVMLSSAYSDFAIRRMVDCGVDFYILRPFEAENLVKQIVCLFKSEHQTVAAQTMSEFPHIANKRLEEKLINILISIGIPAHIKGYTFLREAVKLIMQKPTIINAITKQLYPSIARIHETSPSKVERAIRHAIEVSWSRKRMEILNDLFNVKAVTDKDRPTNGEFISLIAEKLLLENLGQGA